MKKSSFMLIAILAFPGWMFSQETVHRAQAGLYGTITNAITGDPLAGASISIDDARSGTIADASGSYSLRNIPEGHHVIEISYSGFGSIVEHIDIHGNMRKDYALSPAVVETQTVVVTGVSSATSIRKAAVPLLSIRKGELLQSSSTNIIDALANKPGIAQLQTGPGISKPVIRGLGYNRVVVVNDGVRQEGQQWGDEHGTEIDEMSVARVEVLKGPASLMYGSDALAGVIHLISHTPVAEGTLSGNLLYNYQHNNRQSGFHGSISGNKHSFNWNAYGSYKTAADYQNRYDGRVLNSRFNERNFGGYAGINRGWGYSHLVFSSFNQEVGLIEGDRDPSTGNFLVYPGTGLEHVASGAELNARDPLIPKQNIRHYKLISDNAFAINRGRLKLNLAYQQNLRSEYGNPEDPAEQELNFKLSTFTYNLQWLLPQAKDWHVTLGAGGIRQTNANKGLEVIIPEYGITDVGVFIFGQRFFKRTTLSGGLRVDHRSLSSHPFSENGEPRFVAFSRSFTNIAGSAGLSYEPTDNLTLKFNLARGYRAPNMAELGSNGAHEGTDRYEYGQRDLKSESSMQLDAGIEFDQDHISLSLSAFYNHINNFIYYRRLVSVMGGDSLVNVGGEELEAFRFDQQDASISGFEAEIDFHPHPLDWLHFENSFSYVRGRFRQEVSGTENLPMIPAARWTTELRANFSKVNRRIRNLYLKTGVRTIFRQSHPFTAYGTETATPGYSLVHAGFGFEFHSKASQLFSLHLSGNNLGDVAYIDHMSRLKYTDVNEITGRRGVFNMGRNWGLKLLIPIKGKL